MIERNNNTNIALERMFEELFEMINGARKVPFMEKIMLDEDDLVNALDDLKEAIPREIKNATQVLEEQKNIVNKAYMDADRIVQQAKDEAERIVGVAQAEADAKVQQEEIVRQANAVAEEIRANAVRYQDETKAAADEYALRIKQDSLQYADEMLAYLGKSLEGALQGLNDNRDSVANEIRNVATGAYPAAYEEQQEAPAEE